MPTSNESNLDRFYKNADPWGYFTNPQDLSRKRIIANECARYKFSRVLDIGCGNGFITESVAAYELVGIDISESAIAEARSRSSASNVSYKKGSIFDLPSLNLGMFDAVIITGVLYRQYIGNAHPLVYMLVDQVLRKDGILISVHIDDWYLARFPYPLIRTLRYSYRHYIHLLEVYRK